MIKPSNPRTTTPPSGALTGARPGMSGQSGYNQIRAVTAPFVSKVRNTRSGRGMLVPASMAANTPTVITHNLGRLAQGFTTLTNGTDNSAYPGFIAMYTAPGAIRTPMQQEIFSSVQLLNAIIEVT